MKFIIYFFIGMFGISTSVLAADLHVPENFKTIQEAVNFSNSGDVIRVAKGVYEEDVIVSSKNNLWIVGDSPYETFIKGTGDNHVVSFLDSTNSGIKYFDVSGSAKNKSGVYAFGSDVEIYGNILHEAGNSSVGLYEADDSYVHNNIIFNNEENGIWALDTNRAIIESNTVDNNIVGIYLYRSDDISLGANVISGSSQRGIKLAYSTVNYLGYDSDFGNVLPSSIVDENNLLGSPCMIVDYVPCEESILNNSGFPDKKDKDGLRITVGGYGGVDSLRPAVISDNTLYGIVGVDMNIYVDVLNDLNVDLLYEWDLSSLDKGVIKNDGDFSFVPGMSGIYSGKVRVFNGVWSKWANLNLDISKMECDDSCNCSDGYVCNSGDSCDANSFCVLADYGECDASCQCGDGYVCSDSNSCNSNSTCVAIDTGECDSSCQCGDGYVCSDMNSCDSESVCVLDTGECDSSCKCGDGYVCSDGNSCNSDSVCEPVDTGECDASCECGDGYVCSDGNSCNSDSKCVESETSDLYCLADCSCPDDKICENLDMCGEGAKCIDRPVEIERPFKCHADMRCPSMFICGGDGVCARCASGGDCVDNDGDGLVDEDAKDGFDNDGDGCVDEDGFGGGYCFGNGLDDDGDGFVDEDVKDCIDNDLDGLVDEEGGNFTIDCPGIISSRPYFDDVPMSHWSENYVDTLYEYDSLHGYLDGLYRPEQFITRTEALKILMRANSLFDESLDYMDSDSDGISDDYETYIGSNLFAVDTDGDGFDDFSEFGIGYNVNGEGLVTYDLKFNDIDSRFWYFSYVMQALDLKIVSGYESGYKFGPMDEISRAEFLKLILDIRGVKLSDYGEVVFDDVPLGHWVQRYVATGVERGYISRAENFRPWDKISRSEAAKVIYRLGIQRSAISTSLCSELSVYPEKGICDCPEGTKMTEVFESFSVCEVGGGECYDKIFERYSCQ